MREGEMTATIVEGVEPVLLVVMHEFGDLPIYVSGGGLQLVVSTLLWPCDEQNDRAAFNEFLLKAQKIVPLSNFGITTVDGRDYYELMGEISSKTTLHPEDRAAHPGRQRHRRRQRPARHLRKERGAAA